MRDRLSALTDVVRRVVGTVRRSKGGLARGDTRHEATPPVRHVDDGVHVEYTPNLDGDPDPGEVVWAWVPYEGDPHQGKDRPVVVIGRHGDALAGVALTSKRDGRDDRVEVGSGDWDSRDRPSYAKIDRLLDIDPGAVRREGAILDRQRFDRLVEAIDRHHDLVRWR